HVFGEALQPGGLREHVLRWLMEQLGHAAMHRELRRACGAAQRTLAHLASGACLGAQLARVLASTCRAAQLPGELSLHDRLRGLLARSAGRPLRLGCRAAVDLHSARASDLLPEPKRRANPPLPRIVLRRLFSRTTEALAQRAIGEHARERRRS